MNAEILSEEMHKIPPTELVTVRRWQRSAAAEGRWGSLTKCGVTKLVTVCRVYDGPSCRFVMKFREVIPVPIFKELKCFGINTLDGRYDGLSQAQRSVEGLRYKTLKLLEFGYLDYFSELHDEPAGRAVMATTVCHALRNPILGQTSPSSFSSCTMMPPTNHHEHDGPSQAP